MMKDGENAKPRIALVHCSLPSVAEIDQFALLNESFDIAVVTSESIAGFIKDNSRFKSLTCIALPDHDENTTFLPGLESVLNGFDIVIVKERIGLYAYQTVKAKLRNRFRLLVWVDNLTPYPAHDVDRMRTVREEVMDAADGILVQTKAAKDALLLEGVKEARITYIKPWTETQVSGENRKGRDRAEALLKIGLEERDIVIGHMGNLEWEDGLLDLVYAVKLLIDEDPTLADRLKVVFCSIGSFSSQVRERMVRLGIDRSAVFVTPSRDAVDAVLRGSSAIFYSSIDSVDRRDGDPYRVLIGMANEVPVIASRNALVEEVCGKHRLDFCAGSPASLQKAIKKLSSAKAIVNNIVAKNKATCEQRFSREAVAKQMREIFERYANQVPMVELSSIDKQVLEVEAKVANKMYLEAIDLIDTVFDLEDIPSHHKANLYRLIGDSFIKLGDSDASKNAYLEAIECDPYSAKAYIGLGTAAMTKLNYSAAVIHFQKSVSLAPEDEMANLGLGLAFQGLEEFDEATKWITKSLEINPENTASIFSLVKIANERNKYEEATRALQNYIDRHPYDNNMIYSLAGIHFKVGSYQEVVELLQGVISSDPMDSRAQSLIREAKQALEGKTSSAG